VVAVTRPEEQLVVAPQLEYLDSRSDYTFYTKKLRRTQQLCLHGLRTSKDRLRRLLKRLGKSLQYLHGRERRYSLPRIIWLTTVGLVLMR
jgi:hypothetical protein